MEWGGAALMSVEHAPAHRRGFFGSFTQIGSSAGMLLATAAFSIVHLFTTEEQFAAYGWRIPFLASAVLVAIGALAGFLLDLAGQRAHLFRDPFRPGAPHGVEQGAVIGVGIAGGGRVELGGIEGFSHRRCRPGRSTRQTPCGPARG